MFMLYGYCKNEKGEYDIHVEQAQTIFKIYALYLEGYSIGRIVNYLEIREIPSPSCKPRWTSQAIANLLSNYKYIPIVTEKTYIEVQREQEKRSTRTAKNERKATRYNSQDILSGLLVCGECRKNYRRITRRNGEVVWRCADRVDNGVKAQCCNLHTVSESEIKNRLMKIFDLEEFDDRVIKAHAEKVEITRDNILISSKG